MITRIAVALICCFAVCGQTVTGNLQGTVKDPAGVVGYRLNPNWGQISAQRNGARSMRMMLRYMF